METLLKMKMEMPEIGEGKRFDRVNEYLDRTIGAIEKVIAELQESEMQDWDKLNKVFLKLI